MIQNIPKRVRLYFQRSSAQKRRLILIISLFEPKRRKQFFLIMILVRFLESIQSISMKLIQEQLRRTNKS